MAELETLYPEHGKLSKVSEESQAIGEFLEWLTSQKHVWLCTVTDELFGDYAPCSESTEHLLAAYFDIDLPNLELEKRQMLRAFRSAAEEQCD